MARLSPSKLTALKGALTEDAVQPGQAAQAAGVTYATAKRYYDLWADEIKRTLEAAANTAYSFLLYLFDGGG